MLSASEGLGSKNGGGQTYRLCWCPGDSTLKYVMTTYFPINLYSLSPRIYKHSLMARNSIILVMDMMLLIKPKDSITISVISICLSAVSTHQYQGEHLVL
jgi:hypothetical protein